MDPNSTEILDDFFSKLDLTGSEEDVYNSEYYPESVKISRLTETEWNSQNDKPIWIDSSFTKSYKLIEVDKETGSEKHMANFLITKVEVIDNPYLKRAFELRKRQRNRNSSSGQCGIMELFHATAPSNVDSICSNNFNWRLNGRAKGFKHGHGVSFSPRPWFANNFGRRENRLKTIIVTDILYHKSCVGYPGYHLPPDGCDTTQSPNTNVFVKFEDSEFLPTHVVHYENY